MKNTLSDNGDVTRDICQVTEDHTHISNVFLTIIGVMLRTRVCWYGMTYKEDVEAVQITFKNLIGSGLYKEDLYTDLQHFL